MRWHVHEPMTDLRQVQQLRNTTDIHVYTDSGVCRKYGGHGQSGQAIKLFQITPYVSDFQTLNNPGS